MVLSLLEMQGLSNWALLWCMYVCMYGNVSRQVSITIIWFSEVEIRDICNSSFDDCTK